MLAETRKILRLPVKMLYLQPPIPSSPARTPTVNNKNSKRLISDICWTPAGRCRVTRVPLFMEIVCSLR